MVIPKQHIDHFTDLPDELASHILLTAQKFGRRLRNIREPARIGYVVHGFGVPHAHLNVVPLHQSDDIMSAKHVELIDGGFRLTEENLDKPSRAELDAMAKRLSKN